MAGAESCHSPRQIHGPVLPQHQAGSPAASLQPAGCRQGQSRGCPLCWAGRHLHHYRGAGLAAASKPGGLPPRSAQGCSRTCGTAFVRMALLCRSQAEHGAPGCCAGPTQPCCCWLHQCKTELYPPVLWWSAELGGKASFGGAASAPASAPKEGMGRAACAVAQHCRPVWEPGELW